MDNEDDFDLINSPHVYLKGANGVVNNKNDNRNDDSFFE